MPDLIQVQTPPALNVLRLFRRVKERIGDHQDCCDRRTGHGQNNFPVREQSFQLKISIAANASWSDVRVRSRTPKLRTKVSHPPASPHKRVFYRNSGRVVKLRAWGLHWIAQHANTANANLHGRSRHKRTHAGGRASGNQISRKVSSHEISSGREARPDTPSAKCSQIGGAHH